MADQHKFWLVWGIGKPAPTVQHKNPMLAEAEAERLALKHPGTVFVVMAASKAFRTTEPRVESTDLWMSPDAFDKELQEFAAPPPSPEPVGFDEVQF